MESRGLWDVATRCLPIAVKEVQALFNTLESLLSNTRNARIDVFVDNKALLHSWERQVSKSSAISQILKDISSFTMSRKLSLSKCLPKITLQMLLPEACLILIVPLVPLPGIK